MTPKEQRIAIAVSCGWKVHPRDRFIVTPPNSPNSVQPLSTIPDYLNDLNAMHEAEKALDDDQWISYMGYLGETVLGHNHDMKASWFLTGLLLRATAAQRAEAFLRTLNLWDDTK